jgi:hypothetical protein
MAKLRVPFSATARARLRIRLWTGLVLALLLIGAISFVSVLDTFRPASFALPAALYVCVSAALSWGFMIFVLTAKYRARIGWHLMSGGLFGSGCGVFVLGTASVRWHLPTAAAAAAATCAALLAGSFAVRRTSGSARRSLAWSVREPADRLAAPTTYVASQDVIASSGTSADERKIARLNAAVAAIAQSRGDAPDGLVLAERELRALLDDPPDDWLALLSAAADLVDAIAARAGKHGDLRGYPHALDLLADVADRMPPDLGAMAVVHSLRADFYSTMASRIAPGPESDAHAAAAIASLRSAIAAVAPPLRALLPQLHAQLGVLLADLRADPDDLSGGIACCRTAIRLARPSGRTRAYAERSLAILLVDQAWETADQLAPDPSDAELAMAALAIRQALDEAQRRLRRALRHGRLDGRAEALALLARVHTASASILGGPDSDQRAREGWQAAARAVADGDSLDRVRVGQGWVSWAVPTQEVQWCAEAYAYLMSTVSAVVAVRYLAEERDRVLTDLQAVAEEAGYWLAEAGRYGDAAIALELGRAVSLSEVLGRDRPRLEVALQQAGRLDALQRYRRARDAYGGTATHGDDELISAAQRAWAEYDSAVREVAVVTEIDLPGTAPTLTELAKAARDGPVVYLAGAAGGGYAIVVPRAGAPAYLPMPRLTRAAVADHAEAFLRHPGRAAVATVAAWLWGAGIGELARALPAGTLVTIIPVGLLSLLPVHAAGGPTLPGQAPGDWAYLADHVDVRYAHNARTLLRAFDRAESFGPAEIALLAMAAPDADPLQPLPHTVREVAEVVGRWSRARAVTSSAAEDLRPLLVRYPVWHFACHCNAVPERVLDSALLLAGEPLTLRAILALPAARRRLAVLSACETHLSGVALPDEAMGLPAGLLHAGFAGVIASAWAISDQATVFFMARFYDYWLLRGRSPAAALAETQRWIRTATYADLDAYVGGVLDPPASQSARRQEMWRSVRPYSHPHHWAAFALTGQ